VVDGQAFEQPRVPKRDVAEALHVRGGKKLEVVWGDVADPWHLLSQSRRDESATDNFKSPFGAEFFC
jgi:hypothetical protein